QSREPGHLRESGSAPVASPPSRTEPRRINQLVPEHYSALLARCSELLREPALSAARRPVDLPLPAVDTGGNRRLLQGGDDWSQAGGQRPSPPAAPLTRGATTGVRAGC